MTTLSPVLTQVKDLLKARIGGAKRLAPRRSAIGVPVW